MKLKRRRPHARVDLAPVLLRPRDASSFSIVPRPPEATRQARVSLTMIVRNEEGNLPACLASVRGLFDETVVVDTGSTDNTKEIAREFGAKVFDFPWCDSFAAARNASLDHATGDYAFWLDADDRVEPEYRGALGALLRRLRVDDPAAYLVRCDCDVDPEQLQGGIAFTEHIRLFPIREDIRWEYPVHEQILPSLHRARVVIRTADVVIHHTGYGDATTVRGKGERNLKILLRELEDRPDDMHILFHMTKISFTSGDWAAVLDHGRRVLPFLLRTRHPESLSLFGYMATAYMEQRDPCAALQVLERGLAAFPAAWGLWFWAGCARALQGDHGKAESCLRKALKLGPTPGYYTGADPNNYNDARRNLARILGAHGGDPAEIARLWRDVLADRPGDPEATAGLERLRVN